MASDPVVLNALVLEVLNRNNYKHWRSRMKTYLLSEDLWDIVEVIKELPAAKFEDEYKAWTQKNAKALYAIQNSCGSEMFSFISEIEKAKNAWKTLEQECKIVQGYDENNADHLERYISFTRSVSSGNWDKAKECLGEVDVHSVVRAINPRDDFGDIALHVAARKGHVHIVKELVQLMTQEDLKTKNAYCFTALHIAVKDRHAHIVKELGPLMGEVKDGDGDTALHIAIKENQLDIVKDLVLLMSREDLKIKNNDGYTALHLAVKENQLDIVKDLVLLMSREDLKIKNNDGYTALHLAVNKGNMPIVKEFVKKEGENHIVEDNFDRYIPVTDYVINGDWDSARNALCVEIRKGHVDVIERLVLLLKERQEDLELKTSEAFTSFGSGINLDVSEEVLMQRAKYMVEQYEKALGIILETKNERGETALHLVVSKGRVDFVEEVVTLMRPEALEEKEDKGYTALGLALDVRKDGEAMEMAKCMAKKNNKVFGIPMAPNNDIPVIWALRKSKWELTRYLYCVTPLELLNGPRGSSFICYCLNTIEGIDLAWDLLQRFPYLAFTITEASKTCPMLRLARMRYAFLSGARLKCWKRWIYDLAGGLASINDLMSVRLERNKIFPASGLVSWIQWKVEVLLSARDEGIHIRKVDHVKFVNIHDDISINVDKSEDDRGTKKDFISSVVGLFRRTVKGPHTLCGIHRLYELKARHEWIFEFLQCMGKATRDYDLTTDRFNMVINSISRATEHGHFEFVTHICKANPDILEFKDEKGRSIFHFAIEHRQIEVYRLIYKLDKERRMKIGDCLVNVDNNLLHCAAKLYSLPEFVHIQDASLQMQRELQWFKEVQRIVPPEIQEHRNRSDDMTARELFSKNHKKLMEDAENSIKRTATSCTVVGALIVTIMFAVAFTVPSGNNGNTGFPLFLDEKLFKVFIVADTISLASSTTSVITFLGILTSRYTEHNFLKSLPTKIMIGLTTLFFAITTMMIAFCCALVIMLDGDEGIVSLSVLFASVPVISFVWFLFPLLVEILMSTYGHRIYNK